MYISYYCFHHNFQKMIKFVILILTIGISREVYSDLICNIVPKSDISQNPDEIRFFIYPNKSNINSKEELIYQNIESINNSSFDSSKNLIVLIHGFIQNDTSDFPVVVKNAYLNNGYSDSANIITIDWGKLSGANAQISIPVLSTIADLPLYACAVSNVPVVGRRIAQFLTFLVQNQKTACNKIHIVGQSLGAHVAGIVGKVMTNETSCKISRITGTDPAAPLFFGNPLNQANVLTANDAEFVDIVHVNQGEFGYPVPLGKIDFYVNGGGPFQPQCGLMETIQNFFCAHDTAPHYYAKSIGTTNLIARTCPFTINRTPTVVFGENCPKNATGKYCIQLDV